MWTEPITDRTRQSLQELDRINGKLDCGGIESLSPEEKTLWLTDMAAALNASDLNRIEQNTKYLADTLKEYGYGSGGGSVKGWTEGDFVWAEDLERVHTNLSHLIAIYNQTKTPLPESLEQPGLETINSIEQMQKEIKEQIRRMADGFRRSGTFAAGQDFAP